LGRKVSREAAVQALVGNPNVKIAAADCGVSERTLHRWLREPDFSVRLAEAQRGVTKRVVRSVIGRAEKAVRVLDEIMSNVETAAPARVSAAKTVLEFTLKAIELEEIVGRIEMLERRADG